jgi:SPP1 gp7 family putative phage head morphogenesis protein
MKRTNVMWPSGRVRRLHTFAALDRMFRAIANLDASALIRNKQIVTPEAIRAMAPELRGRAFTIAGLDGFADVMQNVRDRIAELPLGADWNAIKADVADNISPFMVDSAADPEVQARQFAAAESKAELLLRVHGFQAYQAAQWSTMTDNADALPYWQYLTMEDDAVRPSHAALHGLVLPADSPFWETHFPPWEWGCRCQVVPLSPEDYLSISRGQQAGRLLSEVETLELEQNSRLANASGQVLNVSSEWEQGREGAFHWDPASLRIPPDQLEGRYDPEVWKALSEQWKKETMPGTDQTVWDWIHA